jgi:hypothetical protein
MVDARQRTVLLPQLQIVMQDVARQVLNDHLTPATGAEDVRQPIDHLARAHLALVGATLVGRDQRCHVPPSLVDQFTRIAQAAEDVSMVVLRRSGRWPLDLELPPRGIPEDSTEPNSFPDKH